MPEGPRSLLSAAHETHYRKAVRASLASKNVTQPTTDEAMVAPWLSLAASLPRLRAPKILRPWLAPQPRRF